MPKNTRREPLQKTQKKLKNNKPPVLDKKKLKKIVDTHSARDKVTPDMGRNVLITIEIPLSLREKVRSSYLTHMKKNGSRLKAFYSELFKLGFKTNEKSKSTRDEVSEHLEEN